MFACLFQPSSQRSLFGAAERAADGASAVAAPAPGGDASGPLDALAREFSPRVQVHQGSVVSLDIGGAVDAGLTRRAGGVDRSLCKLQSRLHGLQRRLAGECAVDQAVDLANHARYSDAAKAFGAVAGLAFEYVLENHGWAALRTHTRRINHHSDSPVTQRMPMAKSCQVSGLLPSRVVVTW